MDNQTFSTIPLLYGERNEVSTLRYSKIFENNTSKGRDSRWGYPTFISKAVLLNPNPTLGKERLPEDTLTVLCEAKFYVVNSTTTETVHWHGIQSTINDNNLSTSMEHLLHSQDSIDVKFSLDGKNFGAHKLILSARSPVFAAMFKHNMLENQLNEVKISDINPEVFEEFLRFLYSDKISDLRMARDLLVAAEKYNVDSLKLLCEEIMVRDLSAKNATDFLVLADLYRAERLKKQVIFYIKTHPANIMLTESWKNTIIAHPHLFDEVNGPFVSTDSQLSKSSSETTTT
ncbi:speckle-type POZ protein B-like isoform X2 [Planococcus citri]|uniref:speckle-type POZ protein B-like isoform X2 n=1 Tax=Planococcus citri TaxID=170843 RepID=UPI0031F93F5F